MYYNTAVEREPAPSGRRLSGVTRVACLAVALVSIVPLAGCGGQDAGAPATAGPATTAAPTVTTPAQETAGRTVSPPVTAADLAGRTFLIDANRSDVPLQNTTFGGPVTITFSEPMLGVQSGCNGIGAEWRVVDGRLELVGDVYSTAMGCGAALEAQDGRVAAVVARHPEVVLSGEEIELRTPEVTLRGRDQRSVPSTRSLVGPTWAIAMVVDAASGRGGGHAGVTASFTADGQVLVATGGCGRLRGTYEVRDGRLQVRLDNRPRAGCATSLRFDLLDVMVALLGRPLDILGRGDQVRLTAADGSALVLRPPR